MNAPVAPPSAPLPEYRHTPLFPLGKDETKYRIITKDGVTVETVMGQEVRGGLARGDARALRKPRSPTSTICCARRTCKHCARSSTTRKRPATTSSSPMIFLKNANIAAGGVLPMCQDTGTAIIMGKKGRLDLDRRRRRGRARRRRARRLPQAETCAIRSSRRSRCSRRRTPSRTCRRRSRSMPRRRGRLQIPVHRQGRRLGQQGVPVPGDAVDPDA